MTAWGVASSVHTSPTILSHQTAGFRGDQKQAVSVGISAVIVPLRRSPAPLVVSTADFRPRVSASKNSVPGSGYDGLGVREDWGKTQSAEGTGANYWGFNPSASNCRLHSAGASRKRSTPMPRGSRPSTAALTRSGARKASEMVMLTWRTLHFCRVAIS